ncbi:MAG: hypothetical protein A2Y45_00875 [Tenericutes bacterium GWC2_34_14]|nr:MAG: hypothetical protein A2Y45_00875 [Tenericutes bacterium GWC2_34_14]OHE34547.1 MAG: hypothetical protein A2012_08495 [Tenericutes bacterium GWE2_34_108]OHE35904.1 MAG: hypothetical protein A2Y46_03200 [Tenericutes bacterium GWF1_35_14]OHE39010.1 MAG: hypothetical protein A2Y44_06730 [Tenericutes bacterium GWF2_35_184]OHE42455.1 MAG: hypothetical protein A3K26_07440 [Tenericutes bacterium RIFOXYA12_FULL_35_10]OHE42922.1 MAG: hypothetical protein A2221_09505 [Tenericutes bacterium RIFOXYA
MKTLVTDRLILRGLKVDDLDDFFSYCRKPKIGPMAGWAPHKTIEDSYDILRIMIRENEVWGITLKESDHLIGTIGLHVRNFDNALLNQKEIGYVLDDNYWGKGLMLEAVDAILKYAFHNLELTRVICGHATNNIQSKRVIEKSGFIYTHNEFRDHYDHTKIEIMMYMVEKTDYKERQK